MWCAVAQRGAVWSTCSSWRGGVTSFRAELSYGLVLCDVDLVMQMTMIVMGHRRVVHGSVVAVAHDVAVW